MTYASACAIKRPWQPMTRRLALILNAPELTMARETLFLRLASTRKRWPLSTRPSALIRTMPKPITIKGKRCKGSAGTTKHSLLTIWPGNMPEKKARAIDAESLSAKKKIRLELASVSFFQKEGDGGKLQTDFLFCRKAFCVNCPCFLLWHVSWPDRKQ